MLAVRMLIGILTQTKRQIVTNLPLHLGEIKEYLTIHHPSFKECIRDRITIIPEARILKRFWLTLGNDWWIPDVSKEKWALGLRLDYRTAYRWIAKPTTAYHRTPIPDMTEQEIKAACNSDPPEMEFRLVEEMPQVQFIIDELQNIFAARNFLQTSPGALFWLSQQRHLGADLIAITQNIDLVDKEFRDLADDFLYLTNWGRKRKSFFRFPKLMTWSKYDLKPGPGVRPMLSGMLRVDVAGLGQLYDTSAGIGIEGGLIADTKEGVGGLHWLWFVGLCLVAAYYIIQTPGCAKDKFTRLVFGQKTTTSALPALPALTGSAPQAAETNTIPTPIKTHATQVDRTNLVGLTVLNGVTTAYFKDGSTVKSNDKTQWESSLARGFKLVGARINGTNFYLRE